MFGRSWKPDFDIYGIFPLIVGSFMITVLALVLALPLGLGCAILIAEVAPLWVRDILRPAIDTLAGIPSILYGLFGLVILVPFIMNHLGGPGQSVLACGVVLAVMVLPTIISISEDSMRAVPRELREGLAGHGCDAMADDHGDRRPVSHVGHRGQDACWPWDGPSARPWRWSWSAAAWASSRPPCWTRFIL